MEILIEKVAFPGRALARVDGRVIFVDGALPGERVRVVPTREHKNFREADLAEVLEPSPYRLMPQCPLYPQCPGCRYQHVAYEEEIRIKQAQFLDFLRRDPVATAAVCPPTPSPLSLAYRNRIVLHAAAGRGSAPVIGYYGQDNRTLVEVACCPLAMDSLNQTLTELRADSGFLGSLADGMPVGLRCTATDGVLWWKGPGDRRQVTELTRLGPLRVPAASFFQVNPAVLDLLLARVTELVCAVNPRCVVDLFCGCGILALAAAAAGCARVVGVDSDGPAIQSATVNAAALGMKRVSFKAMPAARALGDLLSAVDQAPLLLIVDPPRRGLEENVRRAIRQFTPRHVLYISCSADTLARDLKDLTAAGYRVESAGWFDMFPRTPYFESCVLLRHG